ncbi:MAG: serine/threonine protein kinase [Deltaproteobacteria bacterium]|nr:serine/threonine protein kinase [Deltaproteobacteria bacterium]
MVSPAPRPSNTNPSGAVEPSTLPSLGDTAVHADTLAADDTNADTLAAAPGAPRPITASRAPTVPPRAGSIADTVRQALGDDAGALAADSPQRYAEMRELGRGGMGRVVEAQDRWLGRRVAVKHLLAKHDATLRRRFEQEALVTAQLDHPGIPTVYERSAGGDGHWYTMRLVEGEPLSALLKRAARYEDRLMYLPVLAAVAQTLAHAHERGVIHRDIKPDNVVVGSHGQAVLLDWGIAKVRGLTEKDGDAERAVHGAQGMTLHGSVLGTPAYMAPEQARGDIAALDERCDVFALGAMLFHILTGRPPYQGTSVTDVLAQAREGQVPDIDKLAPQASPLLRDLVRSCMQTDPAARPANAGEFVKGLQGFMAAAMVQQPARGLERFVSATSWFGLVVCLLLALVGWKAAPTLREMGAASYITTVFLVLGVAVGALEWRTAGKHHLLPIGLVMMAMTAVIAIAGAELGMLRVYEALSQPDLAANAAKYRELLAVGSREATGNIPFGLVFALLQGTILALAWRRGRVSR